MSLLNVWGTLKMADFKNSGFFLKFWLIRCTDKPITLELDMIFMFCKKEKHHRLFSFRLHGIFSKWWIFPEKNSDNFEVLMPVTLVFMFSKKEKHHRQLSFDLHRLLLQKICFQCSELSEI